MRQRVGRLTLRAERQEAELALEFERFGFRQEVSRHVDPRELSFVAFGNVAFQLPLGLLSDRIDRHKLIVAIAIFGLVGALALIFLSARYAAFSMLLFVWGGVVGGLYMVGLAILGARYTGADLASANSAYVMLYASGMMIGPPILGVTLDASPAHGLFGGVALLFVAYLATVAMRGRMTKDG